MSITHIFNLYLTRFSDSSKMQDFLNRPLNGYRLERVPGIGEVTAKNMRKHGIRDAKALYGIFIQMRSRPKFEDEIQRHGANRGQAEAAAKAMEKYDRQYN